MPNWIEGTLRVRGKTKDVFDFCMNAFRKRELVNENGELVRKDLGSGATFDYCEVEISDELYIEHTRRAFTKGRTYVSFGTANPSKSEDEMTAVISLVQAWGWWDDDWKVLSDKYYLDMKLIGWEQGMEYKGEVEVLRGGNPTYKETKYDDWLWEAECPLLGG